MLRLSVHGCRPSRIVAAYTAPCALVRQANKPAGMVTQRPLLLVHGNFSQAWSWDDFRPRLLKRGYTVYTINLHWKRKQSGQLPGVKDHALQITDCVRQHKLQDVVLVAHSYGGVPAVQAAAGRQRQRSALVCHEKVQVNACTHNLQVCFPWKDWNSFTSDKPFQVEQICRTRICSNFHECTCFAK